MDSFDTKSLMAAAKERERPEQTAVLDSHVAIDDSIAATSMGVIGESVTPDFALWALVMKCYEFLNFVGAETAPSDGSMDLVIEGAREMFTEMMFTNPDPAQRATNARDLAHEILVNFYGSPGSRVEVDNEDRASAIALGFVAGNKDMVAYKAEVVKAQVAGSDAAYKRAAEARAVALQAVWNQVCRIDACSLKHLTALGICERYGLLTDDARLATWEFLVSMQELAMMHYFLSNISAVLRDVLTEVFTCTKDSEGGDALTLREQVMARVAKASDNHPELAAELAEMTMSGAISWSFLFSVGPMCGAVIGSVMALNELYDFAKYIPVVPEPEPAPEGSGGGGGGGGSDD